MREWPSNKWESSVPFQTLSNAGMGKEMDLVRGSILIFCWEIVVSDSETVFHSIVSELGQLSNIVSRCSQAC